jgi:predicted phosphodiesterase
MRIRVLSDLHLEFKDWNPPKADSDVVVLAGDIHVGVHGIEWARRHFPSMPIVYVPGNHEFYGEHIQDMTQELVAEGRRLGVDVLVGCSTVIGGVRFLGATLWTDFALGGTDPSSIDRAMADAQFGMYDFHVIRCGDNRKFRPTDARAMHLEQVQWLRHQLTDGFVGTTVVVTHHLPHRRSIHPKYQTSDLNPGFASDLGDLMGPSVSLWIHGHTHESFDYVVNGTRVVCNPRGYAPMELNESFDPAFTVRTL